MRLKNGEVCFGWPLAQHVITAGWKYNRGAAQGNRPPRFGGNTGVCGGRWNGARGLPLEWASDPGRHQQLWQYGED